MWGMYALGFVLMYVGTVRILITSLFAFTNDLAKSKTNAGFLPQLFEYLETENIQQSGWATPSGLDKIQFKGVSFKYPNTDNYILQDVSFEIVKGSKIAIVGQNGSGKTTLIKLLCRLHIPTEGKIILNDIDIQDYDYNEYLVMISAVFQDFKLFGFTLGENLSLSEALDKGLAENALEKMGLTMDLDTPISKDMDINGINLSGGEAQKVAIARALYKKSELIVLDEPTSALDAQSEYKLYSDINQIVDDKTVIFISHRLASCVFCDNIIVLDEGRLVGYGDHQNLLAGNKKYQELYNAQAQHYLID